MGDQEIPPADRYLSALFGESGYLSRAFPNYRPRPGQIALAEAVDRAITGRGHLLAEGPTGTGKSLAYAAPASYYAAKTGRSIVIVTANIALQEQIVTKDLPLLRRIAPWHFTYSLLKGRNNYLCVDKLAQFKRDKHSGAIKNPSMDEQRMLPVVERWADETERGGIERRSGDMSELPFEPAGVWHRFSVSSDECKRGRCKFRSGCFAIAASERARQAMLIVTNYHMLYSHLAVYLETGKDVVICPFDVAILDEAHKAPDIARDVFGFELKHGAIHRIVTKIRDDGPELAEDLEYNSSDFFFRMGELARNRERYKARLTGDYLPAEREAWTKLDTSLAGTIELLSYKTERLESKLELLRQEGLGIGDEADEISDELGDIEILLERANNIRKSLTAAMHPLAQARHVFFVEEDNRKRITVSSRLIHAADALTPGLFRKHVGYPDQVEPGPKVAVVATSATLATSGGDFDYIAEELGCPPGYDALVAPSPFDWPAQCLFICPTGMPEPNAPEFKDAVAANVDRIIRLARGRTLGLFTSRRVLDHTFEAIAKSCASQGIALYKQGDAPRTQLLEKFKSDISSVLLGTESFWAGVDVPGESLSVVVIDRLPFPTPDDPILDALAARSDDWFRKYSIPRAMIAFKQGFGRLIRSLECRGVVVCLDNRLMEKRYGKQFLRAIPKGVPKSTRLEAIAEWLCLPIAPAAPLPTAATSQPAVIITPPTLPAPDPLPQLTLFETPSAPPPRAIVLPPDWDEVDVVAPTAPPPAPSPAWDEL